LYFSSSDLIELLSNSVFVQFVFKKSVRIMYGGIDRTASLMKHTWCMHILLHTLVYAHSIAHWCVLILSHTQRCWSTLGSPMHTYLRTIFRWPKAYGVCIVIFWCNDLKGTETNILFATQFLMCLLLQGLFSQILFFFRICDIKGEKNYFCCSLINLFILTTVCNMLTIKQIFGFVMWHNLVLI